MTLKSSQNFFLLGNVCMYSAGKAAFQKKKKLHLVVLLKAGITFPWAFDMAPYFFLVADTSWLVFLLHPARAESMARLALAQYFPSH